ncbi:MAG: T9SS type A sorting domain-containing protein [Flavobacteriales bacterium]|nr:T9SS type A sorting domain-containing protein [Flavobacteriales bacterium]
MDENAAAIYQGNNGGNLTGFAVNSQNAGNAITLRIQSDAAGSCDDGQTLVPLRWTVGCGAVGMEDLAQGGFAVYPNPTDGLLYLSLGDAAPGIVRVRVMDMSGRTVIEQSLNITSGATNSIDMQPLQNGQYMVQVATSDWTRVQRVQVTR